MDELSNDKEMMLPNEMATNDSDLAFVSLESDDCSKRLEFNSVRGIVNQLNNLSMSTANGTVATSNNLNNNNCRINGGAGDENDSGVDTGVATLLAPVQLQRALSNNSAGYTSSSGGMDCQFASCNSSLLSVCSDSIEDKPLSIVHNGKMSNNHNHNNNNDCTSENGSESSSVSGDKQRQKPCSVKKRVALAEPKQTTKPTITSDTFKSRMRATSVNRSTTESTRLLSNGGGPSLATSERARARSREKQITSNSIKRSPSSPNKKATKPTTLSLSGCESTTPNRTITVRRAVSMSRRTPNNRTPNTEDGRWPSIVHKPSAKVQRHESLVIRTKVGQLVLDSGKTQTPDRYITLPRRKRANSEEDLSEWRSYRSTSSTRQDRMTSSTIVRRPSTRESPNKPLIARKPKTIIYHEALVQTVLTSQDIDDAFAGHINEISPINAKVTRVSRDCQVDIRDKYVEKLEEQIRSLTADNASLKRNLKERSQLLASMEQQLKRERDEKHTVKQNTERFLDMLRSVNGIQAIEMNDNNCDDSLSMLESQIQLSGHALEEKQCEIVKLREFCKKLQAEMSLSMQVQQSMLEERNNFEKETNELQDFLQDEKTAIVEALKDAEAEIEQQKTTIEEKNAEIERLQDECRHLVRICEQRRQEFLGMQSKCDSLKTKGMNLMTQQNAASLTLADLKQRLTDLVDELTSLYNISNDSLETDNYHMNGNGEKSSIIESVSIARHQELIKALVKAIDCATRTKSNEIIFQNNDNGLKSSEMLDSETEPQLMIENGLEDDTNLQNASTDSFQNLCEAISNRQKIEEMMNQNNQESIIACNGTYDDNNELSSEYHTDQPSARLVENVIQVDRLITKLLKILQIIQIGQNNQNQNGIEEKASHQNGKLNQIVANDDEDKENQNGNDSYEHSTTSNINGVIETLNGIQSIVKQCPALENLQRDLELMLSTDSNGNAVE